MDEEKKGEETQEEAEPTLENQEENTEDEEKEKSESDSKEDIDFEKEVQELEQKPQRTKLEKAVFAREQIDKRIQELGGESWRTKKEEPQYITKEDMADDYAHSLAKSESERKIIMWHYKNSIQRTSNIREDIDNAYWLAHKGKIRRTHEELQRIQQPGRGGGGAGQKLSTSQTPEMPKSHQFVLKRRGYILNPKTGEWEAKHTKYVYDSSKKEWVSVKK